MKIWLKWFRTKQWKLSINNTVTLKWPCSYPPFPISFSQKTFWGSHWTPWRREGFLNTLMITLISFLCSKCFRFHGLKLVRNCFGSNIYILYVLEWKFNFKYSSSQGWNFFFYSSRTNYLCWILIQFIGVGRVLSLNLTWRNPLKYVR